MKGLLNMIVTKKFALISAAIALAALLCAFAFAIRADFGNFTNAGTYELGQFRDVGQAGWYGKYVEDAYNLGLLRGKAADVFDPGGLLTLGEAVTIAARIKSLYQTGEADFVQSVPFYLAYANYALTNGIIERHSDYGAYVSRAMFAQLIFNALPPEAFGTLNIIPENGITDVAPDDYFSSAVHGLYQAGVLGGYDSFGTFFPGLYVTRAEACAIAVRAADPTARIRTILPSHIPAEIIFKRNADAVFMLQTFDGDGRPVRTGSGFFISETGLAATVLHALDGSSSAIVTLYNGQAYPVRGLKAHCRNKNLAIIKVDPNNSGFSHLSLADSDAIEIGNMVYVIGSPQSLINTVSKGIISHSRREMDTGPLIQFTAPISFGSGGSPILNSLGQVIGLASSSMLDGQNLNLAVPVNLLKELEVGQLVSLESLLHQHETGD